MRKIHRSFADRVMALGERLNRAEQELSGPMHQQAEQILKQGGALEEAATTCSLTGVLNRRGLEMNLSAAAEEVGLQRGRAVLLRRNSGPSCHERRALRPLGKEMGRVAILRFRHCPDLPS